MGVIGELLPSAFVLGLFIAVGVSAFRATDGAERRAAVEDPRRRNGTEGAGRAGEPAVDEADASDTTD